MENSFISEDDVLKINSPLSAKITMKISISKFLCRTSEFGNNGLRLWVFGIWAAACPTAAKSFNNIY